MYTSNIIFEGRSEFEFKINLDHGRSCAHQSPPPPQDTNATRFLSRGMWAGTEHPTCPPLPSSEGCGPWHQSCTPGPSPLLRDVDRFRSCSEGSGDGGGGIWWIYMVRSNSLTPDTDVTNFTQTKTPNRSPPNPNEPNPNDACLMTTTRPDDDDDKSAQRQKI